MLSIQALFSEAIQDAGEETFELFSQNLPSQNLGFVDSKASTVEVEIGGSTLSFKQSPGLLNSQREAGTTGAVLWRITPLLGEWLASGPQWLTETGVLLPTSNVVELGCGITGLLGIVLAHRVSNYILTDQGYVMKTLRENLDHNFLDSKPNRSLQAKHQAGVPSNLHSIALDWELDSPREILNCIDNAEYVDLVMVCDCVYNEYLIQPLLQTMVDLCQIASTTNPATVMVAQQLRSDAIFESFLEAMLQHFLVWRIPDSRLPDFLRSGSGYVVHLAQLNQDRGNSAHQDG